MKSLTKLCFGLMICFALFTHAMGSISTTLDRAQSDQDKVIGNWQGVLKVPGGELRIIFKISQNEDGTLKAAMDSPDQGASDIPVSAVTFENDSLHMESSMIRGRYDGQIQADAQTIKGAWKQSGMTFPLDIQRIDAVPKLNRPQEPKPPFPYLEEEVTVPNKTAEIELSGTFTKPNSGGPFPAVILISGSGPQDRDEAIFGHRPFFVAADHLTRQGIAVLRMDDRGVGKSKGDFSKATSKDFASDVMAGIDYLRTRKDIDPKRIGLIGHSEGGIIAPMVAAQSQDVAFIVLMAGTGFTGEEILYLQAALIAKANGATDSDIAENRAGQEKIFKILKEETTDSMLVTKLKNVMQESYDNLSEEQQKAIGEADPYINAQIKQLTSLWFRFFLTYDPIPALKQVKCPVLAINGELDLQVPPKENLAAIEAALQAGGNKNYTIKE
ncbi:MAG: alpha/beta fold hydrolase, partial [bacterium]|nr:alpha/beta fold hydrolase [bacterium]